jgi:hypothetical protein
MSTRGRRASDGATGSLNAVVLEEEGCFDLGRQLTAVTFHQAQNVIIAVVEERKVKVIDVGSDTIVHQAFAYRPSTF